MIEREAVSIPRCPLISAPLSWEAFALKAGIKQVGALSRGTDFIAAGLDAKRLLYRLETKSPGNTVVENLKVVVLKLDNLAAVDADQVIVGRFFEEVRIISGLAITQVNFLQESGLGEKGEGSVEGCPGCAGIGASQLLPQIISGKVLIARKNDVDDGIPLRGMPEAFCLDERVEAFADLQRHDPSMPLKTFR